MYCVNLGNSLLRGTFDVALLLAVSHILHNSVCCPLAGPGATVWQPRGRVVCEGTVPIPRQFYYFFSKWCDYVQAKLNGKMVF